MSTKKERRQFSPEEKVEAIRQVLARVKTVSEVCDNLGTHPNVYYRWQKEFLDAVYDHFKFQKRGRKNSRHAKAIEKYEEEIHRLNAVVAELVKENVELKKKHGIL